MSKRKRKFKIPTEGWSGKDASLKATLAILTILQICMGEVLKPAERRAVRKILEL